MNYFSFCTLLLVILITSNCAQLSSKSQRKKYHATEHSTQQIKTPESIINLPTIHIVNNPDVQKWINYFIEKDRSRFQEFINRGYIYKDVVQTILKENNLPLELYYLALIESGYSNSAKSSAQAVGAWQFMKGTAKNYRLQVNHYIDERRDPIRATEAASKYLNDLYVAFQSWELALAAYNCGEHRVLGAMMKGNSRDFWKLVEKGLLPSQTKNYVPKFMAAVIIGESPEEYGLLPPSGDTYPSVELVDLPSPLPLSKIAEKAELSLDLLQKVNPHILQGVTSPYQSTYEVWVPEDSVETVVSLKDQLVENRTQRPTSSEPIEAEEEDEQPHSYIVKKGDTLSTIANRFGISLTYLRNLNGFKKNSRIMPGQTLRISSTSYRPIPLPKLQYHYVKKGESLSTIARHYGLTLTELKKANGLKSTRLQLGQRLRVNSPSSSSTSHKNGQTHLPSSSVKTHIVKSGDTLGKIARKNGVTINKLRKINHLKNDQLKIGQKISLD